VKRSEIGVAQHLAAQLLRYPTESLHRQLPHVGDIAELLPSVVGAPVGALAGHLVDLGIDQAADIWRASFGDGRLCIGTPDDGAFAELIRTGTNERADFLPAVLENAAARVVAGDLAGQDLLLHCRPALHRLRTDLDTRHSPYALALDAVHASLPAGLTAAR
jgi:nitrate reductase assembly molybdenum cofactor insertion protein NarJ